LLRLYAKLLAVARRPDALAGGHQRGGIFFTIPMRFLTGIALAGGIVHQLDRDGWRVLSSAVGWLSDQTGSLPRASPSCHILFGPPRSRGR
jgi:hypothetical protein